MKCGICYTTVVDTTDHYQCTHCGTAYHLDHLDMWYKEKDTCPYCRMTEKIIVIEKEISFDAQLRSIIKYKTSHTFHFHFNRKYDEGGKLNAMIYEFILYCKRLGLSARRREIRLDSSLYAEPTRHPISKIFVSIGSSKPISPELSARLAKNYTRVNEYLLKYLKE